MIINSINKVDKQLLQEFDCGNEELNLYLKNYALQNNNKNVSRTFVLLENDKVIGYYSLANAQLELYQLDDNFKKGLPKYPIPAIRIARFAVSIKEQRKGNGCYLLKDAFLRILEISKQSGICFIIVDSKSESTGFYENFGFQKLTSFPLTYLLPLSSVEKAYLSGKDN